MPERFSFEEPPQGEPVEVEKKDGIAVEEERDTSGLGEVLDKKKEEEAEKSPETSPWINRAGEWLKTGTKKGLWGLLKVVACAPVLLLWFSLKAIEKTAELAQKGSKKIK